MTSERIDQMERGRGLKPFSLNRIVSASGKTVSNDKKTVPVRARLSPALIADCLTSVPDSSSSGNIPTAPLSPRPFQGGARRGKKGIILATYTTAVAV